MSKNYTYNSIIDDDVSVYKKTIIGAKISSAVNDFVNKLLLRYPNIISEYTPHINLRILCTIGKDDGNITGSTSIFTPSYVFQVEIGSSVESLKSRLIELIKSNIDIAFENYLNNGYIIKLSF